MHETQFATPPPDSRAKPQPSPSSPPERNRGQPPQKSVLAQSRAAQLLGKLTLAERANLEKFAENSFLCPSPDVLPLLRAFFMLAAKNPAFSTAESSRDRLFLEAFNLKRNDPARLDRALDALASVTESFIAFAQLQKDPLQKALYATQWAASTADKTIFEESVNRMERSLKTEPESHHKFYQAYRLEHERFSFPDTDRHGQQLLAYHRLEESHQQFCAASNMAFAFSRHLSAKLLSDAPLQEALLPKSPLVEIYQQIEQILQRDTSGDPAFEHCFALLKKHFSNIAPEEREMVFRFLVNICNGHLFRGKDAATGCYQRLHDLYSWATSQKGFTNRWLQSDDDYLNVVAVFSRTNLNTLEQFISTQRRTLSNQFQHDAEAIARASLAFYRKEFVEADKFLRDIQSRHNKYLIRKHLLLLRVAFELGLLEKEREFEACDREMEAYRKYFERDAVLAESRRACYLRDLELVKELVKWLRKPSSSPAIFQTRMLQELDDPEQCAPIGYDWLRAKIEGLTL